MEHYNRAEAYYIKCKCKYNITSLYRFDKRLNDYYINCLKDSECTVGGMVNPDWASLIHLSLLYI